MTIIGRTIKDGDVISIVRKYLVSGIMIDDEYEDSIVGTPQGGNLSPLHVKLIEPPCTERYARWCERSKIPHQEEFSPTRLLLLYIAHDISLVSLHAVSFEVVGCCSNLCN